MNRIVIIGNGFDKAHFLPTGYGDFLNYLTDSIVKYKKGRTHWEKEIINGHECRENGDYVHRTTTDGNEDTWIGAKQIENKPKSKLEVNPHEKSIYFKSLFQENERLGYWSDLEFHYFQTLYKHKGSTEDIDLINREFDHLKQLLFDYLKTEIEDNPKFQTPYRIDKIPPILSMLQYGPKGFKFEENYFVTFNYTSKILNRYSMWLRAVNKTQFPSSPIHIHGNISSPIDQIVFGYGDENSSEYKELELLQNNKLLTNFKTFQYLRSSKYDKVLGLLELSTENYIQIIGHSSGLSDKALLRTIFQHKNVKHIESTYYKDETKYFENLFNISRIFDDNTLMRDKLIPLSETFMITK